jgi:hypothetical protein
MIKNKLKNSIFNYLNHDLIYNEVKCDFITVCWLENKTFPETIKGYFTCIQNIVEGREQERPWDIIMRYAESDYAYLMPLFEYLFCVPCTSAPVVMEVNLLDLKELDSVTRYCVI